MSDEGEERDLLAAEYVLGVLTAEQSRALEALALHDPSLSASIAAWQDRLAPLSLAVRPEPPPPVLWRRLALAAEIDTVIAGTHGPPRRRWWRSVGLWRATTVGAMAVAASMTYALLTRPEPMGRPLLAALAPAGSPGAMFLVRVDADGRAVVVAAATPDTPAGKSLELWRLNLGATAPVSLGVLPPAGPLHLVIDSYAGTKLLVSQEPPGGSPTGQPTGPVVYSGTLTDS